MRVREMSRITVRRLFGQTRQDPAARVFPYDV